MTIDRQIVADKLGKYLRHEITLDELVDWAEHAMMDGEFEERNIETIRNVVSRLGLADVRTFGLTWDDCQELLRQLGFAAQVQIVAV
jgi:hypothetical protein